MSSHPNGGMPARGAVVRWSWRLFRRDWRQHLLIVILLTASVAAAVGFTCAAYNVAPASGNSQFGDATHFFRFEDNDAASLQAKLDAGLEWFGSIDAIGHNEVPVPGTEQSVDYRSQDPDGAFGGPMLALRTGRYPVEENEAAVTRGDRRSGRHEHRLDDRPRWRRPDRGGHRRESERSRRQLRSPRSIGDRASRSRCRCS